MDLVLKLRESRRLSGLTQEEAAKRSGVHAKTISAMESGHRIDSLKVKTLQKLLKAYKITEAEFFSEEFELRLEGLPMKGSLVARIA